MRGRLLGIFLAGAFFAGLMPMARAEEFYCEVMGLEGVATVTNQSANGRVLEEGDVLKVDDVIEVGSGSYVDLAYDREWNNVTRVEENSKIRIRSLYPTTLELESGGIYAKLKALPKESTFDVQTPTAIASVRGTEYRTTFLEGETQIYNFSDSDVSVYGLDNSGRPQATPVVIRNSEKTQVIKRGQAPAPPRRMEVLELQHAERFRQGIEAMIRDNVSKGRFGKIQDLKTAEKGRTETPKGNALVSKEGEGGERARSRPKILSGDEARSAAENIVVGGPSQPESAEPDRETRMPERGPGQDVNKMQEDVQRLNDNPSQFDADKVQQLRRQVDEAVQNSPPEQRQLLEKMQRQVNETGQRMMNERRQRERPQGEQLSGQKNQSTQEAKGRPATRQVPKPSKDH